MGALVSAIVSLAWEAAMAAASVIEYGIGVAGSVGT